MADLPPEPTILGIKLAHLVAGAAGGLSRSLTNPGGSIMRHVTTAVVGTIVAGYGTPTAAAVTARYLGVPDIPVASMEGMVGVCARPDRNVAMRGADALGAHLA